MKRLCRSFTVAESNQLYERIFQLNRKWVEETTRRDPGYFKKLGQPQTPNFLFIGCSDSRVPADRITGLDTGELFVHRNIANLVVASDLNLLSVLQFSVEVLQVPNIIVCGHYGCGGVKASMQNNDLGLMENWLRNIRDVQRLHQEELDAIEDEQQRWNRLVELNVVEQCINLFKTSVVQKSIQKTKHPRIRGLVYDIEEGLLRELPIPIRKYAQKYGSIYRVTDRQE